MDFWRGGGAVELSSLDLLVSRPWSGGGRVVERWGSPPIKEWGAVGVLEPQKRRCRRRERCVLSFVIAAGPGARERWRRASSGLSLSFNAFFGIKHTRHRRNEELNMSVVC